MKIGNKLLYTNGRGSVQPDNKKAYRRYLLRRLSETSNPRTQEWVSRELKILPGRSSRPCRKNLNHRIRQYLKNILWQ